MAPLQVFDDWIGALLLVDLGVPNGAALQGFPICVFGLHDVKLAHFILLHLMLAIITRV